MASASKSERRLRSCCGVGAFLEPLYWLPAKESSARHRFANVPLCAKCHKVVGDIEMIRYDLTDEIKTAHKKFNGTSWAMMSEHHPHPPFQFVLGTAGILVPENYVGSPVAQGSLPTTQDNTEEAVEEVPF